MSLGLVDYGTDSDDSDQDESTTAIKKNVVPPPPQETPSALDVDGFFSKDDENDGLHATTSILNLPAAGSSSTNKISVEGELEDLVKPKDWEIKLAEKARKKLEKKAKKKERKRQEKHDAKSKKEDFNVAAKSDLPVPNKKTKAKAKISAFGALAAIADDSESEDEVVDKSAPVPSAKPARSSGLLSMLPSPKSHSTKTVGLGTSAKGGTGIMLPPSMRNKAKVNAAPNSNVSAKSSAKRKADSDDDSDDNLDGADYFGLTSAPEVKLAKLDHGTHVPIVASTGFDSTVGPSKPSAEDYVHPSQMYNYADTASLGEGTSRGGRLTDEEAYNLLSRDDSVQMGDRRSIHDIAANIVDVRVDDALGPNVQANLLKNLSQRALAKDAMVPLPKSKEIGDQTAKRKHQITYLANLAVAREEALQEQWAEGRINKKMGREKYGF